MNVVFETSKMVILKPAQIASLGDMQQLFHTVPKCFILDFCFLSFSVYLIWISVDIHMKVRSSTAFQIFYAISTRIRTYTGTGVYEMHLHLYHSLYRVPSFLSSRPNWVPPPLPFSPPPLWVQGGDTLACSGREWGEPIPTMGQTHR
jgi:hypothetical protein